MGRIEQLTEKVREHLQLPWQRTVSGAQRVIMVIYDPLSERALRAKLDLFQQAVQGCGLQWHQIDVSSVFATWMAQDDYREAYFESPDDLALKLEAEFPRFLAQHVRKHLENSGITDNGVVGLFGTASLFGFTQVSHLLHDIEPSIKGRLLVFFPGEKTGNNYRLLDARDGWNYLAVPITIP
jgi:hypothetical protein